jgi:hypothetical protein
MIGRVESAGRLRDFVWANVNAGDFFQLLKVSPGQFVLLIGHSGMMTPRQFQRGAATGGPDAPPPGRVLAFAKALSLGSVQELGLARGRVQSLQDAGELAARRQPMTYISHPQANITFVVSSLRYT